MVEALREVGTAVNNEPRPAQVDVEKVDQAPKEDLLSRVASFKEEETKPDLKLSDNFDINDIEKIEDPNARELVKKAYKTFERGYQKKFQDLADIRRTLEKQTGEKWTPQRVQSLLNDQEFVQAAQQVAGTKTEEEYSNLTEQERKAIVDTQRQIQALAQQNQLLVQQQQDEQLRSKYADYNPQAVDTLTNDLLQGRIQATREHLYKVINFDSAVERAYKLGLKDARQGISENINAVSAQGTNMVANNPPPEKNDKESKKAFWNRLYMENLSKVKSSNIRT